MRQRSFNRSYGIILFVIMVSCVQPAISRRISLPVIIPQDGMSVDSVLTMRRSVRDFSCGPVSLSDVARLLWAGQGITHEDGYRTAPSAGGLYPIDLYLFARNIEGLQTGVYRYMPEIHGLEAISQDDIHRDLASAALDQEWVRDASVSIIVTGAPERTFIKYGERAWRYVLIESGCVVQNILLQSTNLHLASVVVGAFYDDLIRPLIGIPSTIHPIAIISVGTIEERFK